MYLVCLLAGINALFYAWALYAGKLHLQKLKMKASSIDEKHVEGDGIVKKLSDEQLDKDSRLVIANPMIAISKL